MSSLLFLGKGAYGFDEVVNLDNDPTIQFFEEGDWVRVEVIGQPTRYLSKNNALLVINQISVLSRSEKSDLVL